MKLTVAELNTILASLRLAQQDIEDAKLRLYTYRDDTRVQALRDQLEDMVERITDLLEEMGV